MKLNEFIKENAAHGVDAGFLRRFRDTEIFFSIYAPPEGIKSGPAADSPNFEIRLDTVTLPQGRMGMFFASRGDARLATTCAGIPLLRAAEMVCNDMPDIDGLLIHSDSDAWFAIPKDTLRSVVAQIRA